MPSHLPDEFLQRLARLKKLMPEAENRSLSAGEQHALELLIQSLRDLLGPDVTDLLGS